MKKILLIEDDAPLCWLLGKILKNRYEVAIIKNSMEAVSWLSEGHIPDLIIFGMNGNSAEEIELLENIRLNGLYSHVPVVILSGAYHNREHRQHCLQLGVLSYITKPFDPQSLLSEIQNGLLHRNEVVLID